jgi:hypothetical protein
MTLWRCVSERSWFFCSYPRISLDLVSGRSFDLSSVSLFSVRVSSLYLSLCLFISVSLLYVCLSEVEVTLRLTVSQSVSLGVEPHLGLMTRYILLFDNCGLAFVGRPLWREDGSVFCTCCWLLPAQSFSGPSRLGLATIFYCLRFETSLFVASYGSQGHGGGIRSRLHTGMTCVCPFIWCPSNRVFAPREEDTFPHGFVFRCSGFQQFGCLGILNS